MIGIREDLGAGRRALVGDRSRQRDARRPVMEVDVGNVRGEVHLRHRRLPGDVARVVGGGLLLGRPLHPVNVAAQAHDLGAGLRLQFAGELFFLFAPLRAGRCARIRAARVRPRSGCRARARRRSSRRPRLPCRSSAPRPGRSSCARSNSFIAPSAVESRKYHHTEALRGMTLGWSPPLVMTRCALMVFVMCSRYSAMPTSMSTTPSSASRPFPRGDARVRRLAVERERRRDQRRLDEPVADAEFGGDVRRDGDVDVVEISLAHKVGPADKLLLSGRAEHLQRALQAVLLHRLLGRERAGDHHRRH